jgi:hypothetical protein
LHPFQDSSILFADFKLDFLADQHFHYLSV